MNLGSNTPGAPATLEDGQAGFMSTAWSLVGAAAQDASGHDALDRLCRRYWRPVYIYVRGSGLQRCDAEDATQDFFSYLLTRAWLGKADPQRGSFRAFLLTLLRNFLSNRQRRDRAQKRGGATAVLSFETENCERELAALPASDSDPIRAFERSWANCVIQAALTRLASEREAAGEGVRFAKLRPFILQPPGPGDYERLSEALGLPRARVAVILHRHARRFGELIRSEVADTLVDRAGLELEMRGLLDAMAR